MCLGVPGRVVEWIERESMFASARIEFAGLSRVCSMACVPDAAVGEYVVVHAGIAISRIDTAAAEQALSDLSDPHLLEELREMNQGRAEDDGMSRTTTGQENQIVQKPDN